MQLEVEFLDRLTEPVRDKKAQSVSAIIRTALERYDFTNMVVVRAAQVFISVRLPIEIRRSLKKTARSKHTSVGQLVRAAVEAYLPQLEAESVGQLEIPIDESAPAESVATPAAKTRAPRQKSKAADRKPSPVAPKPKAKLKAKPIPKPKSKLGVKSKPQLKPTRPSKLVPPLMTKKRKA